MSRQHAAVLDEDLDLSHLFLAQTAQPSDEATDVPVFEDPEGDEDVDSPTTWGEIVLRDARAGWW